MGKNAKNTKRKANKKKAAPTKAAMEDNFDLIMKDFGNDVHELQEKALDAIDSEAVDLLSGKNKKRTSQVCTCTHLHREHDIINGFVSQCLVKSIVYYSRFTSSISSAEFQR